MSVVVPSRLEILTLQLSARAQEVTDYQLVIDTLDGVIAEIDVLDADEKAELQQYRAQQVQLRSENVREQLKAEMIRRSLERLLTSEKSD